MREQRMFDPRFIFEQPGDAIEAYLDEASNPAILAATEIWRNGPNRMQFIRPELVMLTPIAMHDETYVPQYLGQLQKLQRSAATPEFWVLLSCNAPESMTPDQQQRYDQNMQAIRRFRADLPDFALSYFEVAYPETTPIGAIRRDLFDAALGAAYVWGTQTAMDMLWVNADVDTSVFPGRYLEVVHRSYRHHADPTSAVGQFPFVRHQRTPGMPNADRVIAWGDMWGAMIGQAQSGHVSLDTRTHLYGHSYDRQDGTGEVWNMVLRAEAAAAQSGYRISGWRLPGMVIRVSPRRQYQQMSGGRLEGPRPFDYDDRTIAAGNSHRSHTFTDISAADSEAYLQKTIPDMLRDVAQARLRRQLAELGMAGGAPLELSRDRLRVKAHAHASRIGRLGIALLGGPATALEVFESMSNNYDTLFDGAI